MALGTWVQGKPNLFFSQGASVTRKRTGTSCRIEIHFSIETTEYLPQYTLFRFHIFVRAIVLITEHNYKISPSFIQNNERYNRINKAKWISIRTTLLSADWPPNCFIILLSLVAVERVSQACMAKIARRNVVASTAPNVARRTADVTAWQDSLGIYANASVRQ